MISDIAIFVLLQSTLVQQVSGWQLLGVFLKVGSILYGSGYVVFAFKCGTGG